MGNFLVQLVRGASFGLALGLLFSIASHAADQKKIDPLGAPPSRPVEGETADPEEQAPAGVDMSQANELVRAGKFPEAEELLASLSAEAPDDPRVLLLHGEVLLVLGRHADALPLLRKSAELETDRPRVHFQLAAALQATGDRKGALEALARELEINENTQVQVMVRLNRSVLLEQERDWKGSAAELEAMLALEPGRVQAYGDVASLYLRAGDLDAAAASLSTGLEQGFRSAEHQYILGARYAEKKAYEPAIEALLLALEIDPGLARAERSLASALDQVGRDAEALVHLKRYLELKPDAPDSQRVHERIREIESG